MLRPVRMVKFDCIVTEDKKTRVINALHRAGISQIEFLNDKYLEKQMIERDMPLERVTEI